MQRRFLAGDTRTEKKKTPLRELPRRALLTAGSFFSRLFYIISLVWSAAPLLLVALVVFCLLDGVLPVLGAYVSRDLLNEIARLISEKSLGLIDKDAFEALEPLLFLFLLNLLYLFGRKVLTKLSVMTSQLAGELVVNHIKLSIINKAKEVDMSSFDNPEFYEKLENANREAGMRPITILTATFNVISAVISAVSFVVVLASMSPWAPVIIIAAALPGAAVNFYFRNRNSVIVAFD